MSRFDEAILNARALIGTLEKMRSERRFGKASLTRTAYSGFNTKTVTE